MREAARAHTRLGIINARCLFSRMISATLVRLPFTADACVKHHTRVPILPSFLLSTFLVTPRNPDDANTGRGTVGTLDAGPPWLLFWGTNPAFTFSALPLSSAPFESTCVCVSLQMKSHLSCFTFVTIPTDKSSISLPLYIISPCAPFAPSAPSPSNQAYFPSPLPPTNVL